MSTLEDVAKLAKVSNMTVSRVINNYASVKINTREKVLNAIKELNYQPNMMARALVTSKTKTIAYFISDILNTFHLDVVSGIEQICYENDYNVIICSAEAKRISHEYDTMLFSMMIDGVISMHMDISEEQLENIQLHNMKLVAINNEKKLLNCTNIYTGNYEGGYKAGKRLIELGHKRILMINGYLKPNEITSKSKYYDARFQFEVWNLRRNGFLQAISEHDDVELVAEHSIISRYNDGYNIFQQEYRNRKIDFTAVFVTSDYAAAGFFNAARVNGISIPEKFSIIGYDGLEVTKYQFPKIASVVQDRFLIGKVAAKTLIDEIEGRSQPQEIFLYPTINEAETLKSIV